METSASLLERLAGSPSEDDWRRLNDLYQPLLRAWTARAGVAKSDADDLVQEVLLVVFHEVGSFERRHQGAFQAWLRDVLARRVPGHWVAVTSALGSLPFPGGGADGASAVALQTLVRIAAIEYGPRGIRANAIAPGWREDTLPPELDPALAVHDTPTGRLVTCDDIAATVAWLLSPDAAQLNGEVLRLDGGYSVTRGSRPDPGRP